MIKAVFFDMDGTITDTEKVYTKCWMRAHHDCGYPDYDYNDSLTQRSLNSADSRAHFGTKFGPGYSWDEVHDLKSVYVQEHFNAHGVEIKPGIHELMAFLNAQGLTAAVVTSSQPDTADRQLTMAGIKDLFSQIISVKAVKRGKPYPDVYEYAAAALGLNPSECIAVEDSPNGVKSASKAGCITVMVPDLTPPDDELMPMLYAVCDSLAQVEDVIRELQK